MVTIAWLSCEKETSPQKPCLIQRQLVNLMKFRCWKHFLPIKIIQLTTEKSQQRE
jgi:hypothetical protein